MSYSKNEDYPVYFIRHNFDETQSVQKLYDENLIAIHFGNEFHKIFEDYPVETKLDKGFKTAWKYFTKDIPLKGAIIFSEYKFKINGKNDYKIKFGFIDKNSEIKKLKLATNNTEKGFKTLKMTNVKEFNYSEYPILSMIKPRSRTILPIKTSKGIILNIFRKGKLDFVLESLHFKAQEVMCHEWLRSSYCPLEYRLEYVYANIGGQLQGIDIIGKTKKKILAAQVTFYQDKKKLMKKEYSLLKFSTKNSIKIMFANYNLGNIEWDKEIIKISLKKVWNDLSNSREYKNFIKILISGKID